VKCGFLKKIALDVKNIRKNESLFVPADKTTNFYKMDSPSYNQLLQKNITRKSPHKLFRSIENRSKSIANKLNLTDRINTTAERETFITLKDHKRIILKITLPCRFINPRKSEIGKVSKQILDRINAKVIESTGMNQWKNTKSVLTWFNNIADKARHSFIAFDVQ
jgi:hypothetical protein